MYSLNALSCKSLWIKASAKCINVNEVKLLKLSGLENINLNSLCLGCEQLREIRMRVNI